LIDEDAEERAVDGSFPVGFGEEMLGDLPPEFQGDAFQSVRGTLHDNLPDCRAAREGDFVDARMGYQGRAGDLAEAVDDIHDAGRKGRLLQTNWQIPKR